jgi:hypothetical protein
MNLLRMLSVCLLLVSSQAIASKVCVLPVPDGGDIKPSPPSLTGKIVGVSSKSVSIQLYRTKKVVRISITPYTSLFTVYGGGVSSSDLQAGQHVLVWLQHCTKPTTKSNQASVVQLCSLAAEPCPE